MNAEDVVMCLAGGVCGYIFISIVLRIYVCVGRIRNRETRQRLRAERDAELTEVILDQLKPMKVDAAMAKLSCSICLEDLGEGEGEVAAGVCKHLFHSTCIASWLSKDSARSCPICRTRFLGADEPICLPAGEQGAEEEIQERDVLQRRRSMEQQAQEQTEAQAPESAEAQTQEVIAPLRTVSVV